MNFRRQPKIKHLLFSKNGCPWKKNIVISFPQSNEKDFQAITFPQSGYKVSLVESADGYDLILIGKDGECRLTSFNHYENAELALLELHKKLTDRGVIKYISFFAKAIALILAILIAGEIFMLGGSLLWDGKTEGQPAVAMEVTPQLTPPMAALPSGDGQVGANYFAQPGMSDFNQEQAVPVAPVVNAAPQSNQFELSDLNNAFAKGKNTNNAE